MDSGLAHHPAFADMLSAGLELRLDERDKLRLFSGERQRCGQYRSEADEACITSDHVDRLGNMGSGQTAGIQSLVHDDPLILPQFPCGLTMPDIDRVDAAGAAP